MAVDRRLLTEDEAVTQALHAVQAIKSKVELPFLRMIGPGEVKNYEAAACTVKAYYITPKQIRIDLIEE